MSSENIEDFLRTFDKAALESEFLGMEAALNQNTSDKKEIIQKLFRAIHSLKGTAGILEIKPITDFLHVYEDVLGIISRNTMQIEGVKKPQVFDFFLQGLDLLEKLTSALRTEADFILKDQKELFNFYIRLIVEAKKIFLNQDEYFQFCELDENLF
ncbi:MAG: hypothetical protein COA42_17590 [Alteromonadaceae bacterium]|nr:MAG: hypothetical protein COA42_17590 [Alteromonadaceae bacterium]